MFNLAAYEFNYSVHVVFGVCLQICSVPLNLVLPLLKHSYKRCYGNCAFLWIFQQFEAKITFYFNKSAFVHTNYKQLHTSCTTKILLPFTNDLSSSCGFLEPSTRCSTSPCKQRQSERLESAPRFSRQTANWQKHFPILHLLLRRRDVIVLLCALLGAGGGCLRTLSRC